MIRRGFWLVLGAAAGVTGYRRASKAVRVMLPVRRPVGGWAAGFLRDVRDGRAEYLDGHPLHRGPTLEGQHVRVHHPDQTGTRRAYPGINYAKDGR